MPPRGRFILTPVSHWIEKDLELKLLAEVKKSASSFALMTTLEMRIQWRGMRFQLADQGKTLKRGGGSAKR